MKPEPMHAIEVVEDGACNTSVGSNMEALREHGIVPSMSRPARVARALQG